MEPESPQNPPEKMKVSRAYLERLAKTRQSVFTRFPLLFTLLATFGFVATLYGFERIIDRIDILAENPYILLITGLVTMAITGTLYKRLSG